MNDRRQDGSVCLLKRASERERAGCRERDGWRWVSEMGVTRLELALHLLSVANFLTGYGREGDGMGWPIRMYTTESVYFVTARTQQSRLLLRPSSEVNELVGGVLARAVELYQIELFAFVVTSNHIHLLLRAPTGNLPFFMKYLLGNIATKVGRIVGWRGKFWGRRYSAEPVLDDGALVGRLQYILAHGVKERLVRRCSEWPGLSALPQLLGNARRVFRWFNWTKRWSARGSATSESGRLDARWTEVVTLTLTPLPCWAELTDEERRCRVDTLVAAIEAACPPNAPVLGPKRVCQQSPHARPVETKRTPRPWCHSTSLQLRQDFLAVYREFICVFRKASVLWRSGATDVLFPIHSFKPGVPPSLHRLRVV